MLLSFACHFSPISRAPMPSGVRSYSAVRNSTSRLRAPSAACADARGRRPGAAPDRRAWKQVSATARDLRALPYRNAVSQLRPDLHGRANAMPRRAPASAKSSLVRAPPKSIPPPECWSPRSVAPAAERCSNAVLECPVYRRFAVTSQLQNVADYIPAMCSSGGSSALVVQSIDRNGYAPVSNFEGQASGPTAYVQIPAPPSPSLANSRKPQASRLLHRPSKNRKPLDRAPQSSRALLTAFS
jgi:hypothetical protein